MKKLTILILILTILSLFTSCINNESDLESTESLQNNNPFSVEGNDNETSITNAEFAFGTSVQFLEYTGSAIEFDYEIENGSIECEVGIMVTIDGIPQKYHTDKNKSELYVHSFELSKNYVEKFKIIVTPSIGKAGETLFLNTLSILNPSYMPDPTNIEYANNLKINEAGYIPVDYKKDANNIDSFEIKKASTITKIPDEIIDEVTIAGGDISNGVDPQLYFDDINSVEKRSINIDKVSRLNLSLNGFGGGENKYRIFIFSNHDVIPMCDGVTGIEMNFLPDELTTISVGISKSEIKSNTSLYAIAFPVINSLDMVYTNIYPVQTPIYFVTQ